MEATNGEAGWDLLCFSHLRWDFVYQRPQHLLSRFAGAHRVFYIEEPLLDSEEARLEVQYAICGVQVVRMHFSASAPDPLKVQEELLDSLLKLYEIKAYVAWYYSPMALGFTSALQPRLTVFDCMDELSAFVGAPRELVEREAQLMSKADLVFTGGRSLYQARKDRHPSVHLFPSSVDFNHFSQARDEGPDPIDQCEIPHPRIGFFGVIDERFDIDLVRQLSAMRPDWQLVLVGPTVKIDPSTLPVAPNIHYLGSKSYLDLPRYISTWSVAILPFALNEATRNISPTKIPEYLAAGKPVVSTPIPDVIPWGEQQLVRIAGDSESFVIEIEEAMKATDAGWLRKVDAKLAGMSWDETWTAMDTLMNKALAAKAAPEERLTQVEDGV